LGALAVGVMGCEGTGAPPGPYQVVDNYLSRIAQANYTGACGLLDTATREALVKAMGSKTSCARLFVRCLPSQATNISRDQSQLLYATILPYTRHGRGHVTVAGTAVAKAIRKVNIAKERGTWKLTSYGYALERCPTQHPLRAAKHSRQAAVG
jgi:hypothetical protein